MYVFHILHFHAEAPKFHCYRLCFFYFHLYLSFLYIIFISIIPFFQVFIISAHFLIMYIDISSYWLFPFLPLIIIFILIITDPPYTIKSLFIICVVNPNKVKRQKTFSRLNVIFSMPF